MGAGSMTDYKRIPRQVALLAFFRISAVLGQFLFLRQLTRLVDMAELGTFLGIISVFQWIVIFDFGLAKGARNTLSDYLSKANHSGSRSVVSTVATGTIVLGVLLVPVFFFAFLLVPNTGADITGALLFFSLCLGIYLVISGVDQVCYVLHMAQMAYLAKFFNIALSVAFVVLLERLTEQITLEQLLIGFSVAMVAPHLTIYAWIVRRHSWMRPRITEFDQDTLIEIVRPSVAILLIQIGFLALVGLDRLVLLYLGTADDVARYDFGFRLFGLAFLPASFFVPTIWASLRAAQERSDTAWSAKVYQFTAILTVATIIGLVVISLLWGPLTRAWLGRPVAMSAPELTGFVVIFAATTINTFTNEVCFSMSAFRLVLWPLVIAVAVKISVTVLLYGGVGLELLSLISATAIGYSTLALVAMILLILNMRREKAAA